MLGHYNAKVNVGQHIFTRFSLFFLPLTGNGLFAVPQGCGGAGTAPVFPSVEHPAGNRNLLENMISVMMKCPLCSYHPTQRAFFVLSVFGLFVAIA